VGVGIVGGFGGGGWEGIRGEGGCWWEEGRWSVGVGERRKLMGGGWVVVRKIGKERSGLLWWWRKDSAQP
jgi:hypothetical protein